MNTKLSFTAAIFFIILIFSTNTIYSQTDQTTLTNTDLKLNNNKTVKISDFKGKVVLLDFWYLSCYPCLKAIPDLIKLQKEFKDDLVIIGINDVDDQEFITEYFKKREVNYFSTYKTDKNFSKSLNITSHPTILLYDIKGKLIHTDTGYSKAGMRSLKRAIKYALR